MIHVRRRIASWAIYRYDVLTRLPPKVEKLIAEDVWDAVVRGSAPDNDETWELTNQFNA